MSIHVRTSKVFEAYASAYAKILVFIEFYVAGKNLRWLKIDLISWRRRTLSSLNIFPQSLYLRLNTFASKGAILLLISIADEIIHIFIYNVCSKSQQLAYKFWTRIFFVRKQYSNRWKKWNVFTFQTKQKRIKKI